MCNLYGAKVSYRQFVEAFSQLKLPIVFPAPQAAPNLEPREEIRPTDVASIVRPAEGGVELAPLKWGFAPGRPKAPPVINFRSDGRRFGKGRCLVPASHFFEFTGSSYPKTRWKFTVPGQEWFCLAGLWRPAQEGWPESFTMLTAPPGPDMKPYHDRQVVVVPREHWALWLDPGAEVGDLLQAGPEGSLQVEKVEKRAPAEKGQPSLL